MPEVNRSASKPTAGAARGTITGLLAAAAVSWVIKETGNEELALAAGAIVTGVCQFVGKWLRDYAASKGAAMHATL